MQFLTDLFAARQIVAMVEIFPVLEKIMKAVIDVDLKKEASLFLTLFQLFGAVILILL